MDKKPRKVRRDKGMKRGSLKDQRFMKEMEPYFGPFDPKKLEEEKFMKDMSELFIVHKTKEQLEKEHVDAGIKYNQSLPPNERVMFNTDLLRHITKMIPTPLKDAVAFAKEHKDTDYTLQDGSYISLYNTILQVIVSLKNKEKVIPIFDQGAFRAVLIDSYYDDDIDDSYDVLYAFLDKLKISSLFNFGYWNYMDIDEAQHIFGSNSDVDFYVDRAIEYYNEEGDEDHGEYTAEDFHIQYMRAHIVDDISDERRQAALDRLEAVVKQLNLKDKPQRK
jgi:hypothetical protein